MYISFIKVRLHQNHKSRLNKYVPIKRNKQCFYREHIPGIAFCRRSYMETIDSPSQLKTFPHWNKSWYEPRWTLVSLATKIEYIALGWVHVAAASVIQNRSRLQYGLEKTGRSSEEKKNAENVYTYTRTHSPI